MAQIAAETLGMPVERVHVVGPDTDVTPFDSTTSASRSTNMMGNAVMTTVALLEENPAPSDEEIREYLSGNLCRCGSYQNILRAVRAVSGR